MNPTLTRLKKRLACGLGGHIKTRVAADPDWEWRCARCGKLLGFLPTDPRA
jgi:hypothetical protein